MINLIKIGQGEENFTIGFFKAIDDSQIVIGHEDLLNQIKEFIKSKEIYFIEDDKILEMCDVAINLTKGGYNVSLISSTDVGLTSALFQIIPKYDNVELMVYSGVSIIHQVSDLLGSPLDDYATINLTNPLIPFSEIKNKIKYGLEANFTLAIINPVTETNRNYFNYLKEIILDYRGKNCFVGVVNSSEKIIITHIKNLKDENINEKSILIIGNALTYKKKGKLISPGNYAIKNNTHELAIEHYEKFINNEIIHGSNRECDYYPCHYAGQMCDFCYCPFYPCGDSSTGGYWIKNKHIWSCENCLFIHDEKSVNCIRGPLEGIITEVDDLENKKQLLLKLRRACLLGNNPYDL